MQNTTDAEIDAEMVVASGDAIYASRIRNAVEAQQGKFLVLDVVSHDYEVDWDDMAAQERLEERQPQGVFYGLRIGSPATCFVGGGVL